MHAIELLRYRLSQVLVHRRASCEQPLNAANTDSCAAQVSPCQTSFNWRGDKQKCNAVAPDHVHRGFIEAALHQDHGDAQQDVEPHVQLGVDEKSRRERREPHILAGICVVWYRTDGALHAGDEVRMAGQHRLDPARGSTCSIEKGIVFCGISLGLQPEEVRIRSSAWKQSLQRRPELTCGVIQCNQTNSTSQAR